MMAGAYQVMVEVVSSLWELIESMAIYVWEVVEEEAHYVMEDLQNMVSEYINSFFQQT